MNEYKLNIDSLCCQIKICRIQIKYLLEHKPYFFQRKKLKQYYEQIYKLEDKLDNYYRKLGQEINFNY